MLPPVHQTEHVPGGASDGHVDAAAIMAQWLHMAHEREGLWCAGLGNMRRDPAASKLIYGNAG